MDKGLQFQIRRAVVAYQGNLGKRQLPRKDNALGTQLIANLSRLIVRNARLGRDMALHLRGVFFCQRQHTQIGDDKGSTPASAASCIYCGSLDSSSLVGRVLRVR